MFAGTTSDDVPPREDGHPDPEGVFVDVFEEVRYRACLAFT